MEDIRQRVGQRIRELRTRQGLSQERLALECGLDRTYINSVENGRRNISIVNIEKIARALNVSLHLFFSSPMFEDDDSNPIGEGL
jgi:transcriptional regulator with XRE-family HTH domain